MAICGIFLIELYDRSQQSVIEFTHFISVNTFKMEIYDPNVQQGAIKMERNVAGHCLLVDSMGYHTQIVIKKIWKLKKKKKNRYGKKQMKREKINSET